MADDGHRRRDQNVRKAEMVARGCSELDSTFGAKRRLSRPSDLRALSFNPASGFMHRDFGRLSGFNRRFFGTRIGFNRRIFGPANGFMA